MDVFIGQYSLAAIQLDGASLDKVEDNGGYHVDLYGQFRADRARVWLVNLATQAQYPCYGARSGQGFEPAPKGPGLLTLATPVVPVGTYAFKITQGAYSAVSTEANTPFSLSVVRHVWHDQTLALRRVFPPWYRLGPRSLDTVGLLT